MGWESSAPPRTYFDLYRGSIFLFRQHAAWRISQIKFAAENSDEQPDLFDLEVLYVGQAYGTEGARTSRDRLLSHDTLQAVYAKANEEAPHNEVGMVLLGMENPIQMVRFMPPTGETLDTAEGIRQFEQLIDAAPSFGQRLKTTEAALIRYFRPEFNEKFRDIFPSRSHTSYDECYALDFNSVGFTLDGQTLFGRLWSNQVDPTWLHMKTYFLQSDAERRDMFDFTRL
jgi:hypothetical protein